MQYEVHWSVHSFLTNEYYQTNQVLWFLLACVRACVSARSYTRVLGKQYKEAHTINMNYNYFTYYRYKNMKEL